ncbi:hypothetical protein AC1031_007223 [Aphanomyces cochlioides]|nr:hypothetical protein AC1031_007223 [Aphanomyces cochlioides]
MMTRSSSNGPRTRRSTTLQRVNLTRACSTDRDTQLRRTATPKSVGNHVNKENRLTRHNNTATPFDARKQNPNRRKAVSEPVVPKERSIVHKDTASSVQQQEKTELNRPSRTRNKLSASAESSALEALVSVSKRHRTSANSKRQVKLQVIDKTSNQDDGTTCTVPQHENETNAKKASVHGELVEKVDALEAVAILSSLKAIAASNAIDNEPSSSTTAAESTDMTVPHPQVDDPAKLKSITSRDEGRKATAAAIYNIPRKDLQDKSESPKSVSMAPQEDEKPIVPPRALQRLLEIDMILTPTLSRRGGSAPDGSDVFTGVYIDAKNDEDEWCEAVAMQVDPSSAMVLLHFVDAPTTQTTWQHVRRVAGFHHFSKPTTDVKLDPDRPKWDGFASLMRDFSRHLKRGVAPSPETKCQAIPRRKRTLSDAQHTPLGREGNKPLKLAQPKTKALKSDVQTTMKRQEKEEVEPQHNPDNALMAKPSSQRSKSRQAPSNGVENNQQSKLQRPRPTASKTIHMSHSLDANGVDGVNGAIMLGKRNRVKSKRAIDAMLDGNVESTAHIAIKMEPPSENAKNFKQDMKIDGNPRKRLKGHATVVKSEPSSKRKSLAFKIPVALIDRSSTRLTMLSSQLDSESSSASGRLFGVRPLLSALPTFAPAMMSPESREALRRHYLTRLHQSAHLLRTGIDEFAQRRCQEGTPLSI